MQMNSGEFESFVAEVFSSLGLEVSITQENWDRGRWCGRTNARTSYWNSGETVLSRQSGHWSRYPTVCWSEIATRIRSIHNCMQRRIHCSSYRKCKKSQCRFSGYTRIIWTVRRDEPLAEVSESRENSGHSTLAGEGDEGEKACFSGETQTATESFTLDHRLVLIDYTHPNGSNLIVSLINIDTEVRVMQ